MSSQKVLIIGPGFIGWNILDLLVAERYSVTGFVRREEHAKQIEQSGAATVLGDLDDKHAITQQALSHDILIHAATADHLPSAQALLDAVKQRAEKGLSTIYIHTSGTSVLDDGSAGAYRSDKVYHDSIRSEVDSVPDSAPHREIDLAILAAQKQVGEKAKIAIMIPPLIYGYNPKHGRLTIQIPTLTRFALKHGYSGHVGKGLGVESNIHVLDLARAYIVLLHHMDTAPPATFLANPYYFCETTGEHEPSWQEVAAHIGKELHQAGKIESASPREIPEDLWSDVFGPFTGAVIGLNSRSRAVRLRELGWQPREKDWKKSYTEDELPVILKELHDGNFAGYKGTVAS